MDRLKQLQQYAREEPGDPFNQYALALEYMKTEPSEARRLFEILVMAHPEYLPTYYPYAQLLVEQKETEKAELVFQKGMTMARAGNDIKTLREIQAAHNDWKYEAG